ncbi:PEP-utilizing enzyme [Mycolicibacterium sp.]|uniref:PEP-utilizing enzyme n=1 Tax=Mycolicibacterium sp. TaxID=2320850 RepID=UPI0037C65CCB
MTAELTSAELLADEGYPGSEAAFGKAPWVSELVGRFSKDDTQRFWFLDFHWPRGITPMGLTAIDDGYAWASQSAAAALPLPEGRGLTQRIVGTHVYSTPIAVSDPWELEQRAQRLRYRLPRFVDDFEGIWAERRRELDAWWNHLSNAELPTFSVSDLGRYLLSSRRFLRRATEIHFELMYPLLVNHLAFFRLCAEMDIDVAVAGKFLQGYESKMTDVDRALWELTSLARRLSIAGIFDRHEADGIQSAIASQAGSASQWWVTFQDMMRRYGHRADGPFDVSLPSWNEDAAYPLAIIKSHLERDSSPDFETARKRALAERDRAVESARATLTIEEQAVFDRGLAACERANFPKWQDDHNYYIDLRAALPMRWACLQIADRAGADLPDDGLFLFWSEMMSVVEGSRSLKSMSNLIRERRQYYDYWRDRRPLMPKVLGTVPESVSDPVMIEVFGIDHNFLAAVRTADTFVDGHYQPVTTMRGMAVSPGTARGIARVFSDPRELHLLQPGEVLVCESITPSWSPAFSKIAGCVCDSGGMLSHAAITSREYGIPAVTGIGTSTNVIHGGDEVEVNGSTGWVTVFRSNE